jgi:diguanylate cyclase (GGDEF)-like protein
MIVRRQVGLQRAQDRLWEAANLDTLTRLLNRNRLNEVVAAIIADPNACQERFAVLLLDLDNFKFINDTLGHEAGDLVLRTAAKRIKRASDGAQLVARLGGDEFALVLRGGSKQLQIDEAAQRILRALQRKIKYRGHSVEVSISVGIACFPDHATTWSGIFRAADLALYSAKRAGRNRAVVYDPAMLVEAEKTFAMLESVRFAIENDRITPYYQPQVATKTGEVVGFEALARIVKEDGRLEMPTEFVSALEDPEVSRAFGMKMMEKVVTDMRLWLAAGLEIKRVAVNASTLELRMDDYAERVIAILQKNEVIPDLFEIEITETAAFDDNIAVIGRNLAALAAHGVSIALDDFGTGFASLTHLKMPSITKVKIDHSFVGSIVGDPESRSIVDAIIRLSQSLGKVVVAEGVENDVQLATIHELDCDIAQGFLFSEPMPADGVGTYLLRHTANLLRHPRIARPRISAPRSGLPTRGRLLTATPAAPMLRQEP